LPVPNWIFVEIGLIVSDINGLINQRLGHKRTRKRGALMRRSSISKENRELCKLAKKFGYMSSSETSRGSSRFQHPGTGSEVYVACSGDNRAIRNAETELRHGAMLGFQKPMYLEGRP
jgi:hypothetical protein